MIVKDVCKINPVFILYFATIIETSFLICERFFLILKFINPHKKLEYKYFPCAFPYWEFLEYVKISFLFTL